jgi:hypothetical protein
VAERTKCNLNNSKATAEIIDQNGREKGEKKGGRGKGNSKEKEEEKCG